MASIKSAETLDREVSSKIAKRLTVLELTRLLNAADAQVAERDATIADRDATILELKAEVSRKEIWLNRALTQLKGARKTIASAPAVNGESFADKSARRKAAAIHLGEQLGRGATMIEVDEYLAAN